MVQPELKCRRVIRPEPGEMAQADRQTLTARSPSGKLNFGMRGWLALAALSKLMMVGMLLSMSNTNAIAAAGKPAVTKSPFGTTADGKAVTCYTLTNSAGASADIIDWGGVMTRLLVPDKNGALGDVVLGFDNMKQYETQSPHFGATIGRVGNRIAKGRFTLDGVEYKLFINNGPNSLHGGKIGYDKRMWFAEPSTDVNGASLTLKLVDPDGTEGYPGTVNATVVYTLTNDDTLRIEYTATTDKATPINLTNHTYFNLKDAGASSIFDHVMQSSATQYTPVDATLIPTGEIAPVAGTPIDFTKPKPIGQDLIAMGGTPAGYDHNLVLPKSSGLQKAVEVYEPTTGRLMQMWTTEPGFQFYSGNFLDGKFKGKAGTTYGSHHAFCFEAQHFPDSINHPAFPSCVLQSGQTYRQTTEYRFSAAAKSPL